jgi:hypothetical protein
MNSAKWNAPLPLDGEMSEEQVHQHRLAATDAAPKVHAAGRRRLAPHQSPKRAAALGGDLQLGRERVEARGGGALIGVGAQLAGGDELVVGSRYAPHANLLRHPGLVPGSTGPRGLP